MTQQIEQVTLIEMLNELKASVKESENLKQELVIELATTTPGNSRFVQINQEKSFYSGAISEGKTSIGIVTRVLDLKERGVV